jgi:hypothetical protein
MINQITKGIVNKMGTLICHNSKWTTNWVKMWSYKNFAITIIMLMHKVLTSTHSMA